MGNPLESWAAGISQRKSTGQAPRFPHPLFTGGRGPAPATGCPARWGRGRTGALLGGCGRSSAGCEGVLWDPRDPPPLVTAMSSFHVPCHPPADAAQQQSRASGQGSDPSDHRAVSCAAPRPSLPAPAAWHRDPRAREWPRQ